jgi:hypothetical protein
MNSDDREIARRVDSVLSGQRNPHTDYENASEAVKRAHTAFKASKDKRQAPSVNAAENYARALRDLDICLQVISLTTIQEKAS